jgi:hypothetical protein
MLPHPSFNPFLLCVNQMPLPQATEAGNVLNARGSGVGEAAFPAQTEKLAQRFSPVTMFL